MSSDTHDFRYIFLLEDRKGRRIVALEEEAYTLGRDSHNPIVIYDYQVSRTHATLIRKLESITREVCYCIIDGDLQGNRSTNGILINGKSLESHELKHGDTIHFSEEAQAHYYIIPAHSGIDLFNPEQLNNLRSISKDDEMGGEQFGETLTAKPEENNTSDDKQELIRLASFPELSPNPIIEIDWDGNITYLNPAATIKFEDIYEKKINHPILSGLLSEDNNRQGNLFLREVKIGSEVFEQYVHYLSEKKLIRSYIFDFTKRKQAETQLRESEARYRAIIRQTSEGIFLASANNKKIIEANPIFCELLGYSLEEITQLNLYNVIAGDLQSFNQDLNSLLNQRQDFVKNYLHRCKDASLLNLETSISLIGYRGKEIFCFVTRNPDKQQKENDFSNYHTFHDSLTNLPNRKLFDEQCSIAFANAQRYQYLMAMIIVQIPDLQEFQAKNNRDATDILLKNFAETFQSCLRATYLSARWDEDKFIALFCRIKGPRDPAKIGKRMSTTLQKYLDEQVLENEGIELKLKMGLVVYPVDGEDISTLQENALNSLQQNNNPLQNNVDVSGFSLSPKTASLLKLETLIGNAMKEQQFYLCYQPQIDYPSQKIIGLEALLRWDDPELRKVTARHFSRLTEETDFMLPLSTWILQTAANQMEILHQHNSVNLILGVNISVRQFSQSNFVDTLEKLLEQTNLSPRQLELQLTENCLIASPEFAQLTMEKLSKLNVRICLDNFGSGNSSFGYFEQFSFDTVRLSPSIVNNIDNNSRHRAFIKAITTLGKAYNFRVVAVEVETKEQAEFLSSLDCKQIQGNVYRSPLPMREITNLFAGNQK